MSTAELFLIAMLIIFAVPYLVWRVLRLDGVAPLAIVQIVGGIVLGPGIAGVALPEVHAAFFQPAVMAGTHRARLVGGHHLRVPGGAGARPR